MTKIGTATIYPQYSGTDRVDVLAYEPPGHTLYAGKYLVVYQAKHQDHPFWVKPESLKFD